MPQAVPPVRFVKRLAFPSWYACAVSSAIAGPRHASECMILRNGRSAFGRGGERIAIGTGRSVVAVARAEK
jgi:hypothetical protein